MNLVRLRWLSYVQISYALYCPYVTWSHSSFHISSSFLLCISHTILLIVLSEFEQCWLEFLPPLFKNLWFTYGGKSSVCRFPLASQPFYSCNACICFSVCLLPFWFVALLLDLQLTVCFLLRYFHPQIKSSNNFRNGTFWSFLACLATLSVNASKFFLSNLSCFCHWMIFRIR